MGAGGSISRVMLNREGQAGLPCNSHSEKGASGAAGLRLLSLGVMPAGQFQKTPSAFAKLRPFLVSRAQEDMAPSAYPRNQIHGRRDNLNRSVP